MHAHIYITVHILQLFVFQIIIQIQLAILKFNLLYLNQDRPFGVTVPKTAFLSVKKKIAKKLL